MRELSVVGKATPKKDGAEKVTGRTRYLHDLVLPRLAHGKIVRARHVILAMPRRSIELLHQDSFLFADAQFQDDLQTVLAQPAFKIFAAYRRPDIAVDLANQLWNCF